MIFIAGPGHGGPAAVANAWLEGTYSEVYPPSAPRRGRDAAAVPAVLLPRRHPQPRRAGDARVDPRGRRARLLPWRTPTAPRSTTPTWWWPCVVGDGEAETGPLAASWHSNKFLDPVSDGAVLPILHLNGYKIANPTVLARIPERRAARAAAGYGYRPHVVAGDDPDVLHQLMAATLDAVLDQIADPATRRARADAAWPMIVLRTPEGLDRAQGGRRPAGRGHLARPPGAADRSRATTRSTWRMLEEWMRSYRPEELFDADGRPSAEIAALAPARHRRMSANPHANGGMLLRDLALPDFRDYAVEVNVPGHRVQPSRPGCSARTCAT